MSQFFGKYRGTVENNVDPLQQGRAQVSVPAVLGESTTCWALPCSPYAGEGFGLFAVPPVGANVWVEFEGGDTDSPIWSGCFWGQGQAPVQPAVPDTKVLKTRSATITIRDTPGSAALTLETATGQRIVLSATGIEISNGQGASVKLAGPQVSLNDGALEVT